MCENLRAEIQELLCNIECMKNEHYISNSDEHIVTYDIYEMWEDYSFVLNGLLVRWDECFDFLRRILNWVRETKVSEGYIGTPWEMDLYSYRFEDFITSFARLNEDPLYEEVCRALPKRFREKMRGVQYKKNDIHGLYWRINLLRNRAAHSSSGAYTEDKGRAARFMSFLTKVRAIRCEDEGIFLETMLIDLNESKYIQDLIKKEIIDGGSSKPIIELLFPLRSPSGHGKYNPSLLFPSGYPHFDLNKGFLSLSVEALYYIRDQLNIIMEAMVST